jgi:ATPase family AAA domain-containing protein 3A/B
MKEILEKSEKEKRET